MLPVRVSRTALPAFRRSMQRRLQSNVGTQNNTFNKERQAVKDHAAATSDLWRKLSIYVVIPSLILASVNAYRLWNEHWEHVAHGPALEDKVEYAFQNIRTKNFFWGDGDKTAFWNPKVNYHKPADE
ncbi:unnamed protein product [Zymoseptoria tritici ST99CH_1A5]|uniref:Cytochrome c oxidase subunit n=5 Tax=Zymoseptoria TaxID=1047167 RepID=A0A0F4GT56_9PEZI|nr:uncharacterized protein MYCGRDRAFT_64667 [Zymoseptoria tritici IPO323]KJX99395.1 cytochrome c oxidase subunit VIa like protein [Zymoseptoria brevis]SMQ56214.1 unnamed protein product [Zymoseptoria tritici ST99CH_3D7]SMR62056.1 unnamed protein product [Zymoseptoria tritici ST99CH_1E4]SMR64548.1 unnamed protein product [Zymoseptoria tritici ST99CH_3D1]SMY29889.1 unnamed protein product [Zymoseptoria tritici ST99CH_1A5]